MTDPTPNLGVDLTGHPDTRQDFTYECVWGCTIHVERSVQKPHDCRAQQLVVDRLYSRMPSPSGLQDAPYIATEVLAALEPLVREQLGRACDPDVDEDGSYVG